MTTLANLRAQSDAPVNFNGHFSANECAAAPGFSFGHLSQHDNAALQHEPIQIVCGSEPTRGFKRLLHCALWDPIKTFDELKEPLRRSPVPQSYLPQTWTVPKITLYLFVATAGRRAILAQSGHQFQTTPQAQRTAYSEACAYARGEVLRSTSAWEDFIVVDATTCPDQATAK